MFIIDCLQSITTYLTEKHIQCNQDIMKQKENMYDNTNLSLTNIKPKGKNLEPLNSSSLWYNFSTLTIPLNSKDMKILEKQDLNDSSHLNKLRKNLKLYHTLQKPTPKTYRTIYENRRNNKIFK
jgi:hypothetical protein